MRIFDAIRKHAVLLITLLVIISLGFIYLFIYIPRNEKIILEQRFHVLQDIDKNIHAKIDNSVALLKNLLSAYEPGSRTKRKENEKFDDTVLNNYIKSIPRDNYIITPRRKSVIEKEDSILVADSLDDVYRLEVNNQSQQIVLHYLKLYHDTAKSDLQRVTDTLQEIEMKFTFHQFIHFLLPQNVFDEYIVFSKGKTVYETFPAGVSYVKDDSLMGINKGMSVSSVHDFSISGQEYKVFLQPVHFTSETEWVIGGLLTDARYQSEKKQLPFKIILLLVTLAFCLMLATPWIKLFHMGSKDRLTVVDGAFSILVSMLLMSILFLSFFKYNLPFRTDGSPDSKKNLADKITAAFKKEIDSVYIKLNRYNEILKANETFLADDIVYRNKSFVFFEEQKRKNDSFQVNKLLAGLATDTASINHLFWVNTNGDEIFKWTTGNTLPPHGNYAARDYFRNIEKGRMYRLESPDGKTVHRFYLDQVMSWTTGGFTSVLSIPYSESNDTVAAVSFKLKSLSNTILPAGYQFALIDNQGKVLYHSDPSHNLNENLLHKFSADNELQSSLNAHAEVNFVTDYQSRNYSVRVSPLSELPYFIVVLSDTAFKETRDLEIYSFTFTMLVLFFAFLIFKMLVIFFATASKSFFKKQSFNTGWVGPKRSGHHDYLIAAFFHIVIILSLLLLFSFPSFLTYGFILLFTVTLITLLLNFLYYRRYKQTNPEKAAFKARAIWIMVALIVITDVAALLTLQQENFGFLIIYEIFALWGALFISKNGDKIYKRLDEIRKRNLPIAVSSASEASHEKNTIARIKSGFEYYWLAFLNKLSLAVKEKHYIKSFTLMILTRLIITSGIPVVFFYIASYNYEQNVIIRYKLSEFGNKLVENMPGDSLKAIQFINDKPAVYPDGSWIKDVYAVDSLPDYGVYSREEIATIDILKGFRPDVTKEAITEERFNMLVSKDSTFFIILC